MAVTRLSTDALPVEQRFGWWHDMTYNALVPTVLTSEFAADFRARAHLVSLGAIQLSELAYQQITTHRTPRLIRVSDPDSFHLSYTVRGAMHLEQGRRSVTFGAGDLMVFDTSRPFDGWASGVREGGVRQVVLQLPRTLLPFPARDAERLNGLRIPTDHGYAALLGHFLTQVVADADGFQDEVDGPRLATVLLDLLAGVAAHRLADERAPHPEARPRALFLRVQAYVRQHLADPGLSPASVAAAHHISVRYLHLIFQEHGLTVAGFIRDRRLERARHDLSDPARRHAPVHDIAARWGFRHPAAFSRAFKSAYGISPREYRVCAQRQ
ncbi:helix-turn-helix domain-containing protein [Streptomyces sp. NPDC001941]|uniref:AraC-like ligand-binding domain-containing protein n=1 Tax=Streptomyces sp. NPDC001941 TaxID=3154659 RepID=UPI00331EB2BE